MALQFVFGNSGSGKSTWLYRYVIQESKKEPDKNFLIIVPEQFTMQTQRELVELHPDKAIMNIDVLSFNRLAYRVFDDLGKNDFTVLEETGKNLVLRKVAAERAGELKVLKGNLRKMGYISELKSLISELTQYQVSPEILEEMTGTDSSSFSLKLKDIITMYRGFEEYMEGTYITAEEILELLAMLADQSKLIEDSVLVLDGFTGFTPIQNKLLTVLFPLVSEIKTAVTFDNRVDPYRKPQIQDLFYMSEKMVHTLLRIAEETGTEVTEPVILKDGKNCRFKKADALYHLEQNLFREKQKPYGKEQDQIRLYSLKNPREELKFAAAEISRLVREENYRYKDFAIVSGNVGTYENYAGEVFAAYRIPVFVDTKKGILFHPLTECIRGLLDTVADDYAYESMFHFLKTGLSGFTREQVDRLENYVLALGIRGKKWREKWIIRLKDQTEEDLEELDHFREMLINGLEPLRQAFTGEKKNVREQTQCLYEFLTSCHVEEQMASYSQQFSDEGKEEKAREYEQIYGVVMDLFDKLVELLGEEILSAKEYREILDAGFEAARIGVIPPGYDRVVLGDIERTRLDHIKVLFFIGVNDGIVPKNDSKGGIISDLEREKFAERQIELAPSAREKAFIQKFYLYLMMTKPEEKLYISYTRTGADGSALRKSYLIGSIGKLFPKMQVEELEENNGRELETAESSLEYFTAGLPAGLKGEASEEWRALYRYYLSNEEQKKEALKLTEAALYRYEGDSVTKDAARALYGTVLENSVTRLERFAACAFSHFLTYGLGLKERKLHEFQAVDMGNVFHETLEHYSKELKESGSDWFTVTKEQQEALLERAFSDALLENKELGLYDSASSSFLTERMKSILETTVEALTEQVRHGRFIPESYEVAFGHAGKLDAAEFALSDEERMHLSGRIDRLDLLETESDLYVKVIDYKSGSTKYDLLAIYHGLQLQLVVYLNAAMEIMQKKHGGKPVHPAGIFYYHLDDPFVESMETAGYGTDTVVREDAAGDDRAEAETEGGKAAESAEDQKRREREVWEKILKELRPDGVVNGAEAVVNGMDQEFSGASLVIPVIKKKDGTLDRRSSVMAEDDFRTLSQYVNRKISQIGKEIMAGNAGVSPYKLDKKDPCTYCSYRGVCGYDEKIPGFSHRKLPGKNRDEILTDMKDEVS